MPAFHPRFEDLPPEIAIFPLSGALLLPQGRLPLNIFEPRYLAMTEAALANRRMFGMIQPEPGKPRGTTGPATYAVGCLGRLSSFSETDDGRFLITLTGVQRFRVAEELPLDPGGFRRVRAEYAPFRGDLDSDGATALDRPALLAALRAYFQAQGIEANWDAIQKTEDAVLVITLCMICPFSAPEKQALLEAPTPAGRAAMLVSLLEIGARAPATSNDRPN
ncbi:MAG TPA: LON peptidase substrate-binding domain-containing protein [Acetobacteraceae bacterium]|nr:LON peptidase substrate-binding domain-containing protein [Acetobacteraceae bacterium]